MKIAKLLIITLAALTFFVGCSETGVVSETGSESANSQTTPIGTLLELENAINNEDISDYGDCLASDYEFHFDDDLVGTIIEGYEIPEYWTRTEDIDAMENMFDDEDIVSIYFDIDFPNGSMEYDEDGIHATGTYPVEMEIRNFAATPGSGLGGSVIEITEVECDAVFTLVKVQVGWTFKWKIEKWQDIEVEGKTYTYTSVGDIKSRFR